MRRRLLIGAASLMCAVAGRAETLRVEAVYAAGADAPSRAGSIALAGFAGRGGERLVFAIDNALRDAVIDGRAWFDISFVEPPRGSTYTYDRDADPGAWRGDADAVMRGIAEVDWRDTDSGAKEVEECVAKDDRGKCTEKKKVSYTCRARNVTLRPEVRLVARDGELLYGKGDTLSTSRRFCKNEEGAPSVDLMVEQLARTFAAAVRRDLAPEFRTEDIRVLEGRDGMSKADSVAFRTALKLSKSDVGAACRAFGELEATNPQSVTILFNVGLCRERTGDLAGASMLYERALTIKPGKIEPQEGIARVASRLRAERQADLHFRSAPR